MTYKIKVAILFLAECILLCIFFPGSAATTEFNTGDRYLCRGFSGGFFLIKNDSDSASCTEIKPSGDSVRLFNQNNVKVVKAVKSETYLYLFIEDRSADGTARGVLAYYQGLGLKSSSGIEDYNIADPAFAADDSYFYYINKGGDTVHKIPNGKKPYETVTLKEKAEIIFNCGGNIYALSKTSVINVNSGNEIPGTDIPDFSSCDEIVFYGNICIDDGGRVYSFNENSGFKYVKTIDNKNSFILGNTYCAASENVVYSYSEAGERVGKYVCGSDIKDITVSGNKAALLCSEGVRIISLRDFKAVNGGSSHSETSRPETSRPETSRPDSENNDITGGGIYKVIDKYIIIPEGTTVAAMKKNIDISGGTRLTFYDDGRQITSGKLGTGFRMKCCGNGSETKYTIIIYGDITGEGSVNTRDSRTLADCLLEECDLNKEKRFAADLDRNNKIDSIDLLLLTQMIQK